MNWDIDALLVSGGCGFIGLHMVDEFIASSHAAVNFSLPRAFGE